MLWNCFKGGAKCQRRTIEINQEQIKQDKEMFFFTFGGTFQEIDKSNLMIWVCYGFEDSSLLGKQVL